MQATLRNKAAAMRHLALLDQQLAAKRDSQPETVEEDDWIVALPHRPPGEVEERLQLAAQVAVRPVKAQCLIASVPVRPYHSTSYELSSDVSTASADCSPRVSPMTMGGQHQRTRPMDPQHDEASTSNDQLSPRKRVVARAVRFQRQQQVMQQFLHGADCNYSWTKFQQCVHAGLGDNTREQFWTTQAVTAESSQLPQLDDVMQHAKLSRRVYDDIVNDIYRTMPDVAAIDPTFIDRLYRGLVTHAVLRPDIGYVQGMNMLWANIVVSVSNPNKQLMVAEHIVRTVLPYYFTTDLLGALVDARVLHYYLVRRCPNLERQMARRFGRDGEPSTDNVAMMLQRMTSTYFPDLFNTLLSASQRKRLWDQIMLRGAVAIFEFMLRLFIYARDRHLVRNADNWVEFCTELDAHTRQLDSIDVILATHIPVGRIAHEDFAARRLAATRIVFAELNRSMQ
jgi:hypothetical protein